jgi:hypothetical protein|nr:MAG TPA: protein of unknown function (DUF5371) [Caudoviricetes sp.]
MSQHDDIDEIDLAMAYALEVAEDQAQDEATEAAISRAVYHYYETGVYEDPQDPGNTPCFTCSQVNCDCDSDEYDIDDDEEDDR